MTRTTTKPGSKVKESKKKYETVVIRRSSWDDEGRKKWPRERKIISSGVEDFSKEWSACLPRLGLKYAST